jgi:short-subunit dehydrogenase
MATVSPIALVTGASSGIGEALARELARREYDVALLARRVDRLDRLADEIRATGRRALAVRCDVTRDDDVTRAVGRVRGELGRPALVVANAGFGVVGPVERLELDDYRRQFETNIYGVLRIVQATIDDLKQTRGRLALMGSVAGYVSTANASPYAMSKFALRALAQSLRAELGPHGVSVTLLAPGFVDSEIRQVDNRGVHHPGARDPIPRLIRMPADRAARKMARAIDRRRREVVLTWFGKLVVAAERHLPWLVASLADRRVRSRSEPGTTSPQV